MDKPWYLMTAKEKKERNPDRYRIERDRMNEYQRINYPKYAGAKAEDHLKNKERNNNRSKSNYQKNREQRLASVKENYHRNNIRQQRYDHRWQQLLELYNESGKQCYICGRYHIDPWNMVVEDICPKTKKDRGFVLSNVSVSCFRCNTSKNKFHVLDALERKERDGEMQPWWSCAKAINKLISMGKTIPQKGG